MNSSASRWIACILASQVLITLKVVNAQHSTAVQVTGAVESSDGSALPDARIQCEAPGTLPEPPRGILNGRISLRLDSSGATYVRCTISASNHKSVTLNVDVIEGKAQINKVILESVPGLKLSQLYYFPPTPHGRNPVTSGYLDFYVTAPPGRMTRVDSIEISATRRGRTECADVPGLHDYVFSIRKDVSLGVGEPKRMVMDITAARGTDAGVTAVTGQIDYLHCDEVRLQMSIAYPWTVEGEQKIRVSLPPFPGHSRNAPADAQQAQTELDLSTWSIVRLTLKSSDGRSVSSQLK